MSLSPLTSQTAPVMKDEWSEARKWTTSAISSGAAEPADWDLGRDLAEDLLGDVLEHLGRDEAGGDGVDGEATESSWRRSARASWKHASRARVFVSPNKPDFDAA
jgi:hypothetical protein